MYNHSLSYFVSLPEGRGKKKEKVNAIYTLEDFLHYCGHILKNNTEKMARYGLMSM